jgi:hypothetical protein
LKGARREFARVERRFQGREAADPLSSWQVFLTLMVIGLVGLLVMAVPGFFRHGPASSFHGHAGALRGGAHGHSLGAHHAPGAHGSGAPATGTRAGASQEIIPADAAHRSALRFLPSPRAVFSVCALYGALGNALVRALHLRVAIAVPIALLSALLVERALVRPLWNLMFRFQGQPSSPLEALLFTEARAVVAFRNGRGMVSVVHDGRMVQLAAELREAEAMLPVRVGERLQIEAIDAARERVTVSLLRR